MAPGAYLLISHLPPFLLPGYFQIISLLEVHPELSRGSKKSAHAQGRIRSEPSFFIQYVSNPVRGHIQAFCKSSGR